MEKFYMIKENLSYKRKFKFLKENIEKYINTGRKINIGNIQNKNGNCCPLGAILFNLDIIENFDNFAIVCKISFDPILFISNTYDIGYDFVQSFDGYFFYSDKKAFPNFLDDSNITNLTKENIVLGYEVAKWIEENNYIDTNKKNWFK